MDEKTINDTKWHNNKVMKMTKNDNKTLVQTIMDSSKHTQKSFLVKLSKRKASSDHYGLDFLE